RWSKSSTPTRPPNPHPPPQGPGGPNPHQGPPQEARDEDHFGRYAHTFTAESAGEAADRARGLVEDVDPTGGTDRISL
ncbi:hypothetical protein ACH4XT_15490, partial [Streptomyces avidinii]